MSGQIRVGRCTYNGSQRSDPTFPGFEQILVLTKSSKYGSLGPYCLKNEQGQIMENIYQFSKVYKEVPKTEQKYSRWDNTVIWSWSAETHLIDNTLTKEYLNWREKGMNCKYPVRYPVGYNYRSKCLFAIKDLNNPVPLDYVQSRIQIYLPLYVELVRKEKQYTELLNKVKRGENILIIEVDGPHQESLDYYKEKYNVGDDFIQNSTMLSTKENLNIMLYDTKHAFGHGYCLAIALLMDLKIEV